MPDILSALGGYDTSPLEPQRSERLPWSNVRFGAWFLTYGCQEPVYIGLKRQM
jgi:hypothetical protein